MTQLLSHTIAHFTGPSFMLKANNQPNQRKLGLAYSFFIEQYQFRSTIFVINIFDNINFRLLTTTGSPPLTRFLETLGNRASRKPCC